MNKFILFLSLFMFFSKESLAQISYLEEMEELGTIAGQGLACGSRKHDSFEMYARALMLTKAPSDTQLQRAAKIYNQAKAGVVVAKRMDGGYLCNDTIAKFDRQLIFDIVLFEDGTMQLPDGKILTPRRPYDATKIYKIGRASCRERVSSPV